MGILGIALTPRAKAKKAAKQAIRQIGQQKREAIKQQIKLAPQQQRLAWMQLLNEAHQEDYGHSLWDDDEMGGMGGGGQDESLPPQYHRQADGAVVKRLRVPFGIGSKPSQDVGAGLSVTDIITLQSSPSEYEPERLFVKFTASADTLTAVVVSLIISTSNQFGSLGEVPADQFASNATGAEIVFDKITPGIPVQITIRVDSVDAATQKFAWSAGFYGVRIIR